MKYEITDEVHPHYPNLRRIRALKSFNDVTVGELGGYVETPNNLSQEGNCWLHDSSRMHDNSHMYGNSCMHDNSHMHDNSCMYGNSRMHGSSRMYGNSRMHDSSRMHDNSHMHDNSCMTGDAVATTSPIYIAGFPFKVTISDNMAQIGCISKSFAQWRDETNYPEYPEFLPYKDVLEAIVIASGRKIIEEESTDETDD